MTNHPNRNWRKRWKVDADQRIVTHITGFAMQYTRTSDGGYDGKVISGLPVLSSMEKEAEIQLNEVTQLRQQADKIFIESL